nr:3-keto-5-aminohexanoate cleavage protein [Acidobacteriota bacterium]
LLANHFHEQGLFADPPLYQLVLGVKWAAPATSHTMTYMRDLLPSGAVWAGFGISRLQMPMAAQAVLLGGNVRVGLEDNLYLRRGEFATNVQLVERAMQIIQLLGEEPASPAEARAILGLPVKGSDRATKAAA